VAGDEPDPSTYHNSSGSEMPSVNVKLQLMLHHLLVDNGHDLDTMSIEVVAAARDLYGKSPQRQPYPDWCNDSRVLRQALDRWEYLFAQGSSDDVARIPP
jgi:hypothetical protein